MSEFDDMMNDAATELAGSEAPAEEKPAEAESSPAEETTTEESSEAPASEEPGEPEAEGKPDQSVPYSRFKEVNEGRREAQERASQLERELAAIKAQQQPVKPDLPPGIEPEQLEALRPIMKAMGMDPEKMQQMESKLTQLEAERRRQQEEAHLNAVAARYTGEKGEPKFDVEAAKAAAPDILNDPQKFWEAVYLYQNKDQIVQHVAKQAAKRPPTATKTKPSEHKTSSKLNQALEKGDPMELIDLGVFGGED